MHRYRRLLMNGCRDRYPAQVCQPFIHAPMGGLLTLAQPTIESFRFFLFQERGLWYTPAVADWILHKGILVSQLHIESIPVRVLNTHLTANYTGDWGKNNPFARQEHGELMQLAEMVQQQPREALVLVCGDFNIPRGSWLYESFLAASGLMDPLLGDTRPTFRPHGAIFGRYALPIDYALVRAPEGRPVTVESELRFEDKVLVGNHEKHLSDHYGVELRVAWS